MGCALSQETRELSGSSSIRSASLSSRDLHFKTLSQAKLKNDASVRFTQNDPIHSGMATTDSEEQASCPENTDSLSIGVSKFL